MGPLQILSAVINSPAVMGIVIPYLGVLIMIAVRIPVSDIVPIPIPVVPVQIDAMAMPITETEVESCGNSESRAPMESDIAVPIVWVVPIERRIVIPPPVTVDIAGIVIGNVDDFHVAWLHDNYITFFLDNQVIERFQVTFIQRTAP